MAKFFAKFSWDVRFMAFENSLKKGLVWNAFHFAAWITCSTWEVWRPQIALTSGSILIVYPMHSSRKFKNVRFTVIKISEACSRVEQMVSWNDVFDFRIWKVATPNCAHFGIILYFMQSSGKKMRDSWPLPDNQISWNWVSCERNH